MGHDCVRESEGGNILFLASFVVLAISGSVFTAQLASTETSVREREGEGGEGRLRINVKGV